MTSQDELLRTAAALSSETRTALLQLLAERPASVGEIAATLGLAQSTVSYHVDVLARAGLVRIGRCGTRHVVESLYRSVTFDLD
jgi:DNA-binding transcriptional ArsR family regulator